MYRKWVILVAVLLLGVLVSISIVALAAEDNRIWISFIDVGQGDSILIQDLDGFDVLIDGGRTSAGETVLAFLRSRGVDDIDVMIASHADSDHIGGLIDVLEADDIPVEQVLYNGYPGSTLTWTNFVTAVTAEGLTLEATNYSDVHFWGDITAYILNPLPGLTNPEQNDASVVVLIDHANIEIMLTGDIGDGVELQVASRGVPYWSGPTCCAEILKVGHHGSKYATSASFLATVQPDDAVISVGVNSYGHPAPETLDRLAAAGVTVWRTDELGTILSISDGIGYTISNLLYEIFLPLVSKPYPPTSTPTATATATATATQAATSTATPTATATATPTATATATATNTPPPGNTGDVVIIDIFVDGAGSSEPDEYVEIRNDDTSSIQLQGWTLRDIANHVYTFPSFVMTPGQVCRVYTNEIHPTWCSFNYGSGSAIWNNSGDCAYLRNSSNTLVDEFCY